jgi:cell division protein ZapA (FtsZ GTPase activity inhibitor)
LDPSQTFLTSKGKLELREDFTIKSSTVRSPEAAPPLNTRMTLDAPVANMKQPESVNKQQMNEMMQSIEIIYLLIMLAIIDFLDFAKYKENYDRFQKEMERIQKQNEQLIKLVKKEPMNAKLEVLMWIFAYFLTFYLSSGFAGSEQNIPDF